jgi:hypothetical protein
MTASSAAADAAQTQTGTILITGKFSPAARLP